MLGYVFPSELGTDFFLLNWIFYLNHDRPEKRIEVECYSTRATKSEKKKNHYAASTTNVKIMRTSITISHTSLERIRTSATRSTTTGAEFQGQRIVGSEVLCWHILVWNINIKNSWTFCSILNSWGLHYMHGVIGTRSSINAAVITVAV